MLLDSQPENLWGDNPRKNQLVSLVGTLMKEEITSGFDV